MADYNDKTAKPAAVEHWRTTLESLDGGTEDERFLLDADIHDAQDRAEIEEIIDNGDVPNDPALADAFHELQTHFEDWW